MGPTTSRCLGSTGYMPWVETRPKVVFRPTMPQQAAGTRIDPAVSVPKATSASPFATATALPDEDPPGIRKLLSGFLGVPKYSFMPEGATANSVMFVLPTIRTLRRRAMARQAASAFAGWGVKRKKFEPAVVTTPFMSMLSLIASRKPLSLVSAGNCLINARSPGRCLVNSGTNEHPLNRAIGSAASGSLFKITPLADRMTARLRRSTAFRKCARRNRERVRLLFFHGCFHEPSGVEKLRFSHVPADQDR